MNVHIKKTLMTHEGGSKFYSVYTLQASDKSKTITVVHYGAVPESMTYSGAYPYPSECGKIQVYMGDAHREKVSAKKRRGYDVNREDVDVASLDSDYFRDLFGKHQPTIRDHFIEAKSETKAPSVGVENTKQATTKVLNEPRPASWGTW